MGGVENLRNEFIDDYFLDSNCEELIRRDLLMELADIVKGPAPTDEVRAI